MGTYMVAMVTTVQVSEQLLKELKGKKMYSKESYEEVIWDLLEDSMELSEETKRRIEKSERQIEEGKTIPLSQVKKRLGL
jgi:Zn-dependent M32 family carboxypeptidase